MFAVILLPIYPTFASIVNETTVTEFYRGDIDESSIISSYFGDDNTVGDGDVFIQSKDSYLYVNASLDADNRDVSATKEIIEYEVGEGESFASISEKFNISKDSIFWANDFVSDHKLHPGDTIKVPPVSGLIHTVASWETLLGLAKKYEIKSEDIMRQNLLLTANDLKIGDTIIIPWAKKEIPKPVVVAKNPTNTTSGNTSWGGYSFASSAQSEYVNSQGRYQLVWRQPKHTFYWGNCTWYVAQYKNVTWWGNANRWLANARAQGYSTGYSPSLGAIVQLEGRWYNPYYGHVAIVLDITSTHIIISDMNYRRLGEVTTRKIPINDRAISGYIYVD